MSLVLRTGNGIIDNFETCVNIQNRVGTDDVSISRFLSSQFSYL